MFLKNADGINTEQNEIDFFVGSAHACAYNLHILALKCWGANKSGQTDVPQDIESTGGVRRAGLGFQHTCAIDNRMYVACFGHLKTDGKKSYVPRGLQAVQV